MRKSAPASVLAAFKQTRCFQTNHGLTAYCLLISSGNKSAYLQIFAAMSTVFTLITFNGILYNNPSYSRILIGSRL